MLGRLRGWLGRGERTFVPEVDEPEVEYNDVQQVEMEARKARSIVRLKAEGVPYIDWLPYIEPADHVTLRTPEETARRALCLLASAMAPHRELAKRARKFVKDFGIDADLTPGERAVIFEKTTQHQQVQASWSVEAAVPLFWHIGYLKTLYRPDVTAGTTDVADQIGSMSARTYFGGVTARPVAAVLDETDLIYRYHWAVVDARLNGRDAPGGLDGGVVMERHRALNWLTGYGNRADWDDVTTDT